MNEEVWVTGLGAVCAQGATLPEVWDRLVGGDVHGPATPAKLVGDSGAVSPAVLTHPAFCAPDAIFAGGFRNTARDTLALALAAAREALGQANLAGSDLEGCGVVIGSSAGNALHFLEDYRNLRKGVSGGGQGFADFFACSPAPALARELDLSGPCLTVGNACCSGTDAVGLGWEWIRNGLCRRVLAGGADALSLIPYIGFRRLMIYSAETCRPFDRGRKGLNLGEGAGALLLEAASAAEGRGARPLAKVLGYGAASDAHHLTAPHPEGRGLRQAVRDALAASGISGDDIGFVNAHGTATPDNDRVEGRTLRSLLPRAQFWATKGATGHTLGAAGGIEAVFAAMALYRRTLPASPGFAVPDPDIGVALAGKPQGIGKTAALSTSLGFGGGASAVVLGGA